MRAPLERDLGALEARCFDLVVIGGGIFGAAAARDAALRGLDVALIERDDFGSGASANCFKMVHGGIRYLQHLDFARVRASCHERSALLRLAPHLVRPLPIAVPTYGHGRNGPAVLRAATLAYDLMTLDRNRGIDDPDRRIPASHRLSRQAALDAFPQIAPDGLTGAVVFSDAQMVNPARLVLAFVRSAAAEGAVVANHLEAERLLRDRHGRVQGVRARTGDGQTLEIRARAVLNAAGGWADALARAWLGRSAAPPVDWTRDVCFVIRRPWPGEFALALLGAPLDPDARLGRAARHLFVTPSRGVSLVGVWHRVWTAGADRVAIEAAEVERCLAELNAACPGLALTPDDVLAGQAGLLPCERRPGGDGLSYGKRSILIDHGWTDGAPGLFSLIGVRYTMARGDAERAVDLVSRRLGHRGQAPGLGRPVFGGTLEGGFEAAVNALRRAPGGVLKEPVARALAHNHGSAAGDVLALAEATPELARTLPGSQVLAAEVIHAVRQEMALTLGDVALRRTDLATAGAPPSEALYEAASLMAGELGWSRSRTLSEVARLRSRLGCPARQAA